MNYLLIYIKCYNNMVKSRHRKIVGSAAKKSPTKKSPAKKSPKKLTEKKLDVENQSNKTEVCVVPVVNKPYVIKEEPDYYIVYIPPFWKVDTDVNYEKYSIEEQKEIYMRDKVFQLYCKFELNTGDIPQYGACHRYDKETSGCILVVKNKQDFQYCRETISDKSNTVKIYVALVNGIIENKKGFIYSDIQCKVMKTQNGTPFTSCRSTLVTENAANSASYYEVVEEYEYYSSEDKKVYKFSLVQVKIFTGRTHQIRLHMSNMGTCIVADRNYCHGMSMNKEISCRLFLHNFYLKFNWKGECRDYKIGLPPDLAQSVSLLVSVKKYKDLNDIDSLLDKTSALQ
jgi:23S rRNA-/tRNA-specific pseudouridylate synthase